MTQIEFNAQFYKAIQIIETSNESVFITGKAGTGKSTLLTHFREHTQKEVVILAPTGVAAINIKGATIHSFFKFGPNITIESAKKEGFKAQDDDFFKMIQTIVIDEISMVRADLLDCMDAFLQIVRKTHHPFGGLQMIFFGDLYQLPPVLKSQEKEDFLKVYESPYFFSANVMRNGQFPLHFVELEKIYRQTDAQFIELLNAIRNNSVTPVQIEHLNQRLNPDCDQQDKGYIYLTSTNLDAEAVNTKKLAELKTELHLFKAKVKGNFDLKLAPTDVELKLKTGSQIMFLNNDSEGRWVNGTVGEITDITEETILVKTQDDRLVQVQRYKWKLFRYFFNNDSNHLDQENIGSFTQYPLKLAWAVTIHKSQGKTFDKVIIDIGRGAFAHGQVYVALSRCRTFEGILLKKPIKKQHVIMDWHVVKFLTQFQYAISEKKCSTDDKITVIQNAIDTKKLIEIVYLKANDEKSIRSILPLFVGEMEYLGKKYLGLQGFCQKRQEERVFRVDRILEITS